jgi:methionine-rich copper-binding protein CopC
MRFFAGLRLLVIAALLVLAGVASASAHAQLLSTSPKAGAVVEAATGWTCISTNR